MINELIWDSKFFRKKIGELRVTQESLPQIRTAIEKAKKNGFEYIVCRLQSQHTTLIKILESLGFYLSDIGVVWAIKTEKFSYNDINKNSKMRKSIKIAAPKDISMLRKMVKSLFGESRFYNDPFFSKEEANNLYQTWIENSVKGDTADIVLHIPNKGFIVCRKLYPHIGEIVLIGVKKDFRGRGIGTVLTKKAIEWFSTQGINSISVRTQLRNLNAINFYLKSGFYIKGYDIVFAKIL